MQAHLICLSLVSAVVLARSCNLGHRVDDPSPLVAPRPDVPSGEGARLLHRVPVAFVPNLGQWEHPARYVARLGATTVFLQDQGWTLTFVERGPSETADLPSKHSVPRVPQMTKPVANRGVAVGMSFVGAREPELVAEQPLPGRHNYFLGNDPSKWRSDVSLFGAVRYRHLYEGVDVRVREEGGHLEYDVLLQPGADLEAVEIAVEGIERTHVDLEGALVMETKLGNLSMPAPKTWQEGPGGERVQVGCRYVLRGEGRFGFAVDGRRQDWTLTVDPGLVWSTFLGGGNLDSALAIALGVQGGTTVAGYTWSANFPATLGAFDTSLDGSSMDAFVTQLSQAGAALVFSTFLGGAASDSASAIGIDRQGSATIGGYTTSSDFPTTPGAFGRVHSGLSDVFVTRLSPTGAALSYSSFIGGGGDDYLQAIALDTQGAATVTGYTSSFNYPTTPGAFGTTYHGFSDVFVTRLSPTGSSLTYSTFLGGGNTDAALAIALDVQGAATVAGFTYSLDFPITPGAYGQYNNGGIVDAFVSRLSPTGSSLVYSTYLGGSGTDEVLSLALDVQGAATVAGFTSSGNFPTTPGACDTSFNGGASDAFVTQLSPAGSSLTYSTFLGGTSSEQALGVALDARGEATVVGWTSSSDFPTTPGAFDRSPNGSDDVFVSRLSLTGSRLVSSTFLGGGGSDAAFAICLDAGGVATIAGFTTSSDLPTTAGAFDASFNGGFTDSFIARFDMLPTGVTAFGASSPGCAGPLSMSVNASPNVGNAAFAVTCSNAPASTSGACGLTANSFSNPVSVLGVNLWIDPSLAFLGLTANSNGIGASEVLLPIPNASALAGGRLCAQFFWVGPNAPAPCPPLGWSASNALEVIVQP